MEHQQLIHITRGLQNAAAETNSLVAQQYIRVLSEFFERQPDGTLKAKMVRVELDDQHYSMVPLVSLAAPSGLALDRMRVEMSLKLESAEEERTRLLSIFREGAKDEAEGNEGRAQFKVSLSPRGSSKTKKRPSDHVNIELEFRGIETPESIQRVIEVYTNMMQPIKRKPEPLTPEPAPVEEHAEPIAGNDAAAASDAENTGGDAPPSTPDE